jgi:hypothetical protein
MLSLEELTGAMGGFPEGDDAGITDNLLEWLHIIEALFGFYGLELNGIVTEPPDNRPVLSSFLTREVGLAGDEEQQHGHTDKGPSHRIPSFSHSQA